MKSIQVRSIGAEVQSRLGKSSCGIALVALLLMGAMMNVFAATRTWSSGSNVNWSNVTTWAEGSVPTASDDVSLNVGSTITITNASAANSVTLSPASGTQNLKIFNGTSGNTGRLVIGGGSGTIQRSPTGGTTPNVQVYLQSVNDLGTNALLNCAALEDYVTILENGFANCNLTTSFDIYSHVQMLIGNGSSSKNVNFHQVGGTVKSPNTVGASGISYGLSFASVSTYGTGISNTCNYYLDNGIIQANRIGSGNADGDNFTVNRWYGQGNLFFNNGTIQPYSAQLYLLNEYSFRNYNTSNALSGPKDMQVGTWSPFTVVLGTNGTHTLTTAMATGGYADIFVAPSAQFVDSTNGPGALIKDGSFANLRFCGGDNPYATNTFSGTTTVNGGLLMADFNTIAGSAASSTGTNVLIDAFSPNSKVVLNGGNFQMTARQNGIATNFTGASFFNNTTVNLISSSASGLAPGAQVHNTNLPTGTYLRQNLSSQYFTFSHHPTNSGSLTGQAFTIDAAKFACTQHLAGVTLQTGSTLTVSVNGSSAAALVCGPIDGTGSLTLNGGGTLQLTGVNAYSGATSNLWGSLILGANSWPSNSPSIYLFKFQPLDGSSIPGGIVVGTNQLLYGGNGGHAHVKGDVTINGTLSPGADAAEIQGFFFDNNVTLAGTVLMKLNKDIVGQQNDYLTNIVTLNYGGKLIVTNIGTADFVLGDSFKLFHATNYLGDFAVKTLPALSTNTLAWAWSPTNGTLSVVAVTTLPSTGTNLTFSVTGGNTLNLSWPTDYTGWELRSNSVSLISTSDWNLVTGSTGTNSMSFPVDPTKANVFYRMQHP